jgi:deoxyribodipyrimidine photo-lyase
MNIEQLVAAPRITVRRGGAPACDGAVVYWMQRARRAVDNPALETATAAANALGKPVLVYFGLLAGAPGANLRHYRFMAEGLRDVAEDLDRCGIAFVLRRAPDHEFQQLCQPAMIPDNDV